MSPLNRYIASELTIVSIVHMKFNLDWCVFGYPDNNDIIPANQKCAEVCAGPDNSAKNSLTDQLMRTDAKLQYLYCDGLDIQNTLDNCAACLETVPNVKVLRNCRCRKIIRMKISTDQNQFCRRRDIKYGLYAEARPGSDGQD